MRRKVLTRVGLPVFAIASLNEDELGGRHRDSANVDVVEAGWAGHRAHVGKGMAAVYTDVYHAYYAPVLVLDYS